MNKLNINNVTCKRGSLLIFNDFSFEISSGQTFLIKGNNGSGKTSLLRTISGFIKAYKGEILYDQKNIFTYPEYLNNFQFIGQKNALKDNLSVKKNIHLWELLFKKSIEIENILNIFHLNRFKNKDVSTLSEGQKKCLSLSRLFLKPTPVWLLDEPYVYLDEKNKADLNKKIFEFNQCGGIVIITSNINLDFEFHQTINLSNYAIQ